MSEVASAFALVLGAICPQLILFPLSLPCSPRVFPWYLKNIQKQPNFSITPVQVGLGCVTEDCSTDCEQTLFASGLEPLPGFRAAEQGCGAGTVFSDFRRETFFLHIAPQAEERGNACRFDDVLITLSGPVDTSSPNIGFPCEPDCSSSSSSDLLLSTVTGGEEHEEESPPPMSPGVCVRQVRTVVE